MNRNAWLMVAACLVTGMAQATCYSVYKANGTVLQRSSTPPVNLSEQIGDTVPAKFGSGATMVVSDVDVFCQSASERQQHAPRSLADAVLQEQNKRANAAAKKHAAAGDGTTTASK